MLESDELKLISASLWPAELQLFSSGVGGGLRLKR